MPYCKINTKAANPNPLIYMIFFFLRLFPYLALNSKDVLSLEKFGQFDGLLLILTVIQKGVQKQLLKSRSASTDNLVK